MAGTLNRNLQLLTVSRAGTSDVLGPLGTFAWSMEGMTREFLAASGPGRTLRVLGGIRGCYPPLRQGVRSIYPHAHCAAATWRARAAAPVPDT